MCEVQKPQGCRQTELTFSQRAPRVCTGGEGGSAPGSPGRRWEGPRRLALLLGGRGPEHGQPRTRSSERPPGADGWLAGGRPLWCERLALHSRGLILPPNLVPERQHRAGAGAPRPCRVGGDHRLWQFPGWPGPKPAEGLGVPVRGGPHCEPCPRPGSPQAVGSGAGGRRPEPLAVVRPGAGGRWHPSGGPGGAASPPAGTAPLGVAWPQCPKRLGGGPALLRREGCGRHGCRGCGQSSRTPRWEAPPVRQLHREWSWVSGRLACGGPACGRRHRRPCKPTLSGGFTGTS